MFVFFTHTTWWPNAATAAQRTGGVSQPQELPAPPEGEIPRRSDPTQSYDCNESRSLYSSEHLNSRAPEASAAHCFLQIRHKTQKPAKMSAACGPRCQIKLSVDWKVADETFPKEKKELSGCLFVLRPVRPSTTRPVLLLPVLISARLQTHREDSKWQRREWHNLLTK